MKFLTSKIILFTFLIISPLNILAQDSLKISLDTAIELSLKKNTDIVISNYQTKSSQFALKEAKGNFLPKLYLNANYYRNINRQVIFLPEVFGMGETATKLGADNDYRAALNLSFPVYSNYSNTNKKLVEIQLNYQNEVAKNTKQKVVNATKKAYFNYLIAQEVVKVQKMQLKSAQETFTDVEKRKKLGTLTDYDFTAAKVQVAQAKNSLLEAENTILPLANSLKLLLGLKNDVILKLTAPITLLENEFFLEENPSKMLLQNSILKQLEFDVKIKEKQIKLAQSALYPTLDAIGNYNYQAQENNFDLGDYNWINTSLVGMQLQFSIFNGNITKNKVAQAKIAKNIALEQKEYTTEATKMQLQELLSQLDFSKQKIEVQLENMNLTEEALKLTKKRYQLGVGTFLEVNNAELSYTQARLFWLQAILDYRSAYYDYQLLIGKD